MLAELNKLPPCFLRTNSNSFENLYVPSDVLELFCILNSANVFGKYGRDFKFVTLIKKS